jgi:CO/xanthine dehydrogenase Mo-binding subunit
VSAKKATVVSEVGKVLHEVQCRGQIEGGVLQAIGWALLEEMKFDNGRILNDRMATYIVPTILDAPEMQVEMMERPWNGPPFGAKGVGELPMDGPAPAVCAAIENATGIVADSIPAVPEQLLAWMEAGER